MNLVFKFFVLFVCTLIQNAFASNGDLSGRPVRGIYSVPVSEELRNFASYPVRYKADSYKSNPDEMSFPLPAALVGEELTVTMSRIAGSQNEFVGTNVNGDCQTVDSNLICNVKFANLNIDPLKVEAAIRSQFKTDLEINGRLAVARSFGEFPGGVLSYRLRGRDRNN